jgi:ATP-binding protein involved in chromosome partitioning
MTILQNVDLREGCGDKIDVRHKILVMSGDSGVGKSTVARNLALSLSEKGASVGLLAIDYRDADIASILDMKRTMMAGNMKPLFPDVVTPRLKSISMPFPLSRKDFRAVWPGTMMKDTIRRLLQRVCWGKLDYLIIDLPPVPGDVPMIVVQEITDIAGAIIVSTSQEMTCPSFRKVIGFSKIVRLPILGLIENRSDFQCPQCKSNVHVTDAGGSEHSSHNLGIPYLGNVPFGPDSFEDGDEDLFISTQYSDPGAKNRFNEIIKKIEDYVHRGRVTIG